MKSRILLGVAVSLALVSGCNLDKATPTTEKVMIHIPAATAPSYQVKYEEMAGKLMVGMMKDDIRKAIGDPTETRGIYGGGKNYGLWLYEIDQNTVLRIRFDDDDKIVTWNMVASNVIQ